MLPAVPEVVGLDGVDYPMGSIHMQVRGKDMTISTSEATVSRHCAPQGGVVPPKTPPLWIRPSRFLGQQKPYHDCTWTWFDSLGLVKANHLPYTTSDNA